jgi:adenylate cyclase
LIAQGPFVPDWLAVVRGHILFDLKRYREAIASFQNFPPPHVEAWSYLAASFAQIGDTSGAEQALSKLLESHPGISIKVVANLRRNEDPEMQAHLVAALRKAGLPE